MSTSFDISAVARVLISDDYASKNDGSILAKFVEKKVVNRSELAEALDVITTSALPAEKKRDAVAAITAFMRDTAQGLEKELFAMPARTALALTDKGIVTTDAFLKACRGTTERYALAQDLEIDQATLDKLAGAADLQRLAGVDAKLGRALVDVGVRATQDLAATSAKELADKLKAYAGSMEGYVMKLRAPKLDALQKIIDAAKATPALLSFGSAEGGLGALDPRRRAEMIYTEDGLLTSASVDDVDVAAYLERRGLTSIAGDVEMMKKDYAFYLQKTIAMVTNEEVSEAELLAGNESVIPEEFIESCTYSFEPEITELTDSQGNFIGAKLSWSIDDGSESWTWSLIYDHFEKKVVADASSESANGETEFNYRG